MSTAENVQRKASQASTAANEDAGQAALLRPRPNDGKEDRKPARPPVEEPNQEPAIEDPLPEESREEAVRTLPH